MAVGKEVGAAVADSVGEGSAINVGVGTGVGEAIDPIPPQLMRRSTSPEVQKKKLFVIASGVG